MHQTTVRDAAPRRPIVVNRGLWRGPALQPWLLDGPSTTPPSSTSSSWGWQPGAPIRTRPTSPTPCPVPAGPSPPWTAASAPLPGFSSSPVPPLLLSPGSWRRMLPPAARFRLEQREHQDQQHEQIQEQIQEQLLSFGERTSAAMESATFPSASSSGWSGTSLLRTASSDGVSVASSVSTSSPPEDAAIDDLIQLMSAGDFVVAERIPATQVVQANSCPEGARKRTHSNSSVRSHSKAFCAFCRGNGELFSLYSSHSLHRRLPDGTSIVECPILRDLRCEMCGATGDFAHTRSHCPFYKQESVAVLLKKTPRQCDGSLRKTKKGSL